MSDIRTGSTSDPLTVPEAALRRRSVRHFTNDPIPDDVLDRLLELTLAAPSSWNLQPWRIVLIRDPEQQKELRAACYGQPQPEEAPVSAWRRSGTTPPFAHGLRRRHHRAVARGLSRFLPTQWREGSTSSEPRVARGVALPSLRDGIPV